MNKRIVKKTDEDVKTFIMSNVHINYNNCWEWLRTIDHSGYGKMKHKYKMLLAHRESYRVFNKLESVDNIEVIMHTCDNAKCVNPKHLIPGTHKKNSDDKIIKGRDNGFARINREATHCKHGHEFTPENTYARKRPGGGRICKTCVYYRKYKSRGKV